MWGACPCQSAMVLPAVWGNCEAPGLARTKGEECVGHSPPTDRARPISEAASVRGLGFMRSASSYGSKPRATIWRTISSIGQWRSANPTLPVQR
jgi:hypothetical protein